MSGQAADLARKLCAQAGTDPDAIVVPGEAWRVAAPGGAAYGVDVSKMRPAWMLWLGVAFAALEAARASERG